MDDPLVFQAFRESPARAAAQMKNLEAKLALESQRCLQLEKQVQALHESAAQAGARISDLEARVAEEAGRMLRLEQQMQAFLGRTTHPIAQARDREPRIAEPKSPLAKVLPGVAEKAPRPATRKV